MNITIKPLDTLFFRDGKPFTMGEDSQADSLFPPPPSVLYGALRTAYFAAHQDKLQLANEPGDPTASLIVTGSWLVAGGGPCFPLPMDLAANKKDPKDDKGGRVVRQLPTVPLDTACSLQPMPSVLSGELDSEKVPYGALNAAEMIKYLAGGKGPFTAMSLTENIKKEPKTGIARDRTTGTASQEGKIYQANMLRLVDLEFGASFEGLDLPKEGMLKFGGEGRPAAYRTADPPAIPAPSGDGRKFRLYLASPALFANGWLPGWIDPKTLTGGVAGLKLRLTAASVGRALHIGGFDIKRNKPKPMRRAAPEGSVYHFEITEGTFAAAVAAFHGKPVSELDGSAAQGFGLALVGAVN